MNDEEMVREALRMTEEQFGMKYPAAEMALDRIQSRLQAAEADKTEWRDLYEELHVKLEAAEAELAEYRKGNVHEQREIIRRDRATIHELQEALERATGLLKEWDRAYNFALEQADGTDWPVLERTRQALHLTQNEGSRT